MTNERRSTARHLLMRLALAFTLGWFGVQELHNPADWAVFVPNVIGNRFPGALNDLVILHGFLLTLAAASVFFGLAFLAGSLLGAALLGEVVIGLWLDGGVSDLVIRDIGLFALAGAVALDPVRVWHLDEAIGERVRALRQPRSRKQGRKGALPASSSVPAWGLQAVSGALLVVAVLAFASVLRATGSAAPALPPDNSAFASSDADPATNAAPTATQQPVETPAAEATQAPAETPVAEATQAPVETPAAQSGGTLFASWRYYNDSFQIYPGPVSSDAQQALAGFALNVEDQGPQVVVHLKALSSRYRDANISVDKANSAYFVETSMRDDPNGQENELNDDGVVIVNPQGYLVQ